MKKFAFTIMVSMLSIFFVSSAMAENPVRQGNIYMAGAWNANLTIAGGDLYEPGEDGITHFELDPEVGYFIIDNLAIGARFSFASTSQGDAKSTSWSVGPTIGYYYNNSDDVKMKIIPFARASFQIGKVKDEDGGAPSISPEFPFYGGGSYSMVLQETTYEADINRFHVGAGGIWMLSNSFGVFGEGFFERDSFKQKEPSESDESISGSRFGVNIGVKGFFNFGM